VAVYLCGKNNLHKDCLDKNEIGQAGLVAECELFGS